jgi:hypothetical protein
MPRLNPGDPITADYLNRHDQAADVVLGRGQRPGEPLRLEYDTNGITVKNTSGADRRRGEILEFTGSPLTSIAGGDLWLTGGAVTLANGFGVLQNPIPSNKFGNRDCQVSGICFALVNVTNSGHKFAGPASGNYVLQSAISGPVRIIHKPGSTGELGCAVLLGQPQAARRAFFTSASWDDADSSIVWGGLTAREDGLATRQSSDKEIKILVAGTYMLTVNINARVKYTSSAPVFGLHLRQIPNGSSPAIVDTFLLGQQVQAGGSPSHGHDLRNLNLDTTGFGGYQATIHRVEFRTFGTFAANDTLQYKLDGQYNNTLIDDIVPHGYIELEPLF